MGRAPRTLPVAAWLSPAPFLRRPLLPGFGHPSPAPPRVLSGHGGASPPRDARLAAPPHRARCRGAHSKALPASRSWEPAPRRRARLSRPPQEEPGSPPTSPISPVPRQSRGRRQVRTECGVGAWRRRRAGAPISPKGGFGGPVPERISAALWVHPRKDHARLGVSSRRRAEGWPGPTRGCPAWESCGEASEGAAEDPRGSPGARCWPWAWRRRAVGAARPVFVWNMDEAPFIKLEFWEMTHGLASYTS